MHCRCLSCVIVWSWKPEGVKQPWRCCCPSNLATRSYSYGQPPQVIASLQILGLWCSGYHHWKRLDELIQEMQGNKWIFQFVPLWVKKVCFPDADRPNLMKICGGRAKKCGGRPKKNMAGNIFLVVVREFCFYFFIKFNLLPNGFVHSSLRAFD